MRASTEQTIEQIENILHDEFPGVEMEFTILEFRNHVELLVYVMDLKEYDRVLHRCRQLAVEQDLDGQTPAIWVLARSWTGPWPSGQTEQELRSRREDFMAKHKLRL